MYMGFTSHDAGFPDFQRKRFIACRTLGEGGETLHLSRSQGSGDIPPGIGRLMLEIDISKCTGCRRCEVACSFYHSGKVGRSISRIKVVHIYHQGIDGAVACRQCKERFCLPCPVKALQIGEMGQIVVSPTLCTLCGSCELRCPVGAIEIVQELVYVCDLCGGATKCVDACNQGAISFIRQNKKVQSLKAFKDEAVGLNPGQKRNLFIHHLGKKLRRAWRRKNA